MNNIENDKNLLVIEAIEGFANNQVSIHTTKALSKLEFIGRDEYDKQIFI